MLGIAYVTHCSFSCFRPGPGPDPGPGPGPTNHADPDANPNPTSVSSSGTRMRAIFLKTKGDLCIWAREVGPRDIPVPGEKVGATAAAPCSTATCATDDIGAMFCFTSVLDMVRRGIESYLALEKEVPAGSEEHTSLLVDIGVAQVNSSPP